MLVADSYEFITNNNNGKLRMRLSECNKNPDFAEICGFLLKFSHIIGGIPPRLQQLQLWLQNSEEFSEDLQYIILLFSRRCGYIIKRSQFDQNLIKFCQTYSAIDARALQESGGIHTLSLEQKLRFLKNLLQYLLVSNKQLVNYCEKSSGSDLRTQPLGCDRHGNYYTLENNLDSWAIYKYESKVLAKLKYLQDLRIPIARTRNEIYNLISNLHASSLFSSYTSVLSRENEEDLVIFLKSLSATI